MKNFYLLFLIAILSIFSIKFAAAMFVNPKKEKISNNSVVQLFAMPCDQNKLIINSINEKNYKILDLNINLYSTFNSPESYGISCLNIICQDKLVVTTLNDYNIYILDYNTGNSIKKLSGHKKRISYLCTGSVFFEKENCKKDIIVSYSNDNTIKVWDITKKDQEECIVTFACHGIKICSMIIYENGMIAAGENNGKVLLFDMILGKQANLITRKNDKILSFQKITDSIIAFSSRYYLEIWNLKNSQEPKQFMAIHCNQLLKNYSTETISCFYVIPKTNFIAFGLNNGFFGVVDWGNNKIKCFAKSHNSDVTYLNFIDPNYLISSDKNGNIFVSDIITKKRLDKINLTEVNDNNFVLDDNVEDNFSLENLSSTLNKNSSEISSLQFVDNKIFAGTEKGELFSCIFNPK